MISYRVIVFGIVCVIATAGCSAVQRDVAWPEKRPLGKDFETYKPPSIPSIDAIEYEEPRGTLTLRQALALALLRNPRLRAFSWEVRAREARTLQAGLLPNPELGFELEDFGGSGAAEEFDAAEGTVLLSQLVPLAGKVSKRRRVAALNRNLAGWDYETSRLDVFTGTAQAFVGVLTAQERVSLNEELVQLANRVYQTISAQVEAGKISPIEERRAQVALSQAEIRLERARRDLESSRKRLASWWGSTEPAFEKVRGQLDVVSPIPSFEQLRGLVSQNPDAARWMTEMEQRRADLKLEQANVIPDPIISGGFRRLNETDDHAFTVGLSIPLPVFNRNQGGVLEARYRLAKAEEERRDALVRARTSLSVAYESLLSAFEEVDSLKTEVLPGARSAYNSILEGYRQGKFAFLDVLDAQRTLFDSRLQYVEALSRYQKAVAEVERLIATPLDALGNPQKNIKGAPLRDGTNTAEPINTIEGGRGE